jgi:hypothetical protein
MRDPGGSGRESRVGGDGRRRSLEAKENSEHVAGDRDGQLRPSEDRALIEIVVLQSLSIASSQKGIHRTSSVSSSDPRVPSSFLLVGGQCHTDEGRRRCCSHEGSSKRLPAG